MTRAIRSALGLSSLLLLAACAPSDPRPGGAGVQPDAAVRIQPGPCEDAHDLGTLPLGETTLASDTASGTRGPTGCTTGPAEYWRFSVPAPSAIYFDTFGSEIETEGGLAPEACGSAPLVCAEDGCGLGQARLFGVVGPGTYHLFVAGRTSRDRGAYKLHVHRHAVSANALGELPPGSSSVDGEIAVFSGGEWTCGWSPYAWGYYLGCPDDPGGLFTATVCTASPSVVLGYQDMDRESGVCAAVEEPVPACGLMGAVADLDAPGAGPHFVYVGAVLAHTGEVAFQLDLTRP